VSEQGLHTTNIRVAFHLGATTPSHHEEHTTMFDYIGTVDNHALVPSPVLDETQPKGYRVEQRLQVTLKAASNERTYTVEFRLDQDSQAPSEQLLDQWIESGELVQAFCTGLTARPFVHQAGKTYRSRGKAVQIGEATANLDSFVVFAGHSMAPLSGTGTPSLEEVTKAVRAAYKRGQRQYRAQRNAERAVQLEAQLEERARQLVERRAAQAVEEKEEQAAASNGRKR
jgi:hypothetical protein